MSGYQMMPEPKRQNQSEQTSQYDWSHNFHEQNENENYHFYSIEQSQTIEPKDVPQQLIIFTNLKDQQAFEVVEAIRNEQLPGVRYLDDLDSALDRLNLKKREELTFNLYLVEVPEGQEVQIGRNLEENYISRGGRTLQGLDFTEISFAVIPNPVFELTGSIFHKAFTSFGNKETTAAHKLFHAADFSFTSIHDTYKDMIHRTCASHDAQNFTILLLDSGIAADVPFRVEKRQNFVREANPEGEDDHYHGTAIAMIINDLLPKSHIISYKVVNSDGKVDGYDFLKALCVDSGAQVINLSVAYRPIHDSMPDVFQRIISEIIKGEKGPILVAATGNEGFETFALPASLPEVVAITSLDSRRRLSSFSSYGGKTIKGKAHEHYFALPGGEKKIELIAKLNNNSSTEIWGTSFATAYASAIILCRWASLGAETNRADVLKHLINDVDKNLDDYNYENFGHGLLTFHASLINF